MYGLRPRYNRGKLLRWSVSLVRHGEHFYKEFCVAEYGNAEKAKAAALAYRDELLKQFPPMSRRDFATIVRTNNTSGIPGVSRRVEHGFVRWCAMVCLPDGTARWRTFAVKKYGEEQARERAIKARLELLKLLDGWFVHHPDAIPDGQTPSDIVAPATPRCEKRPAAPAKRKPSPQKRVYRKQMKWTLRNGAKVCRDYWIAECDVASGGTRCRLFAVDEYGEDEARRLAYEQRQAWVLHPPGPGRRRRPRPGALGTRSGDPAPGFSAAATPATPANPSPASAHP